jgi:hypothetical protein
MGILVIKVRNLYYNNFRLDPLEDLFTQDNHKENIDNKKLLLSPDGKTLKQNLNIILESTINQEDTYKEGFKYDYGYSIVLNNHNEDGLMDTYLTGNYN